MKPGRIIRYLGAGLVLGALAGIIPAAAWQRTSDDFFEMVLLGVTGAVLAGAGGVAAGSARRAFLDAVVGLVLAGPGLFFGLGLLWNSFGQGQSSRAFCLVLYTVAASAVLTVSHTWNDPRRVALPAACFACIASVGALALIASFFSEAHLVSSLVASGAVWGGLFWTGLAVARSIFGVNIDAFRVNRGEK